MLISVATGVLTLLGVATELEPKKAGKSHVINTVQDCKNSICDTNHYVWDLNVFHGSLWIRIGILMTHDNWLIGLARYPDSPISLPAECEALVQIFKKQLSRQYET